MPNASTHYSRALSAEELRERYEGIRSAMEEAGHTWSERNYTMVIRGLAAAHCFDDALLILDDLVAEHNTPSVRTFTPIVTELCQAAVAADTAGDSHEAEALLTRGFSVHKRSYTEHSLNTLRHACVIGLG